MRFQGIISAGFICAGIASADPFFDLGHNNRIGTLKRSGNYLASQDLPGHWVVWELTSKSRLLSGQTDISAGSFIDLQNGVLSVRGSSGFDLYALPAPSPIHVAAGPLTSLNLTPDGRFAYSGSKNGLLIWGKNGQSLLELPGNFSGADLSVDSSFVYAAAPGLDSVAMLATPGLRPAGAIRIAGGFNGWLKAGSRFQTRQGSIVRTYDTSGKLVAIQDIPNLGDLTGWGDYFWSLKGLGPDAQVDIYKIGDSNLPVQSFVPGLLDMVHGGNGFIVSVGMQPDSTTVYELASDGIKVTKRKGPPWDYTAIEISPDGKWFTGYDNGVIDFLDREKPGQALGYGAVLSMAGDPNGRMAVATAGGRILLFQVKDDGKPSLTDSLSCVASVVRVSSDWKRLAALGDCSADLVAQGTSVYVFDLTNHSLLRKWEPSASDTSAAITPLDIDLSRDGSTLSQKTGASITGIVYDIATGKVKANVPGDIRVAPRLSPHGDMAAFGTDSIVKLYQGNRLVNAFSGKLAGWYNDSQVIINRYRPYRNGFGEFMVWDGSYLADKAGDIDSSLRFPDQVFDVRAITDSESIANLDWDDPQGIHGKPFQMILNNATGSKLYQTDVQLPNLVRPAQSTSVGKDYLAFQENTFLDILNWRQHLFPIAVRRKDGSKTAGDRGNFVALIGSDIMLDLNAEPRVGLNLSAYSIRGELLGSLSLGKPVTARIRSVVPLTALVGDRGRGNAPIIVMARAGTRTLASAKLVVLGR